MKTILYKNVYQIRDYDTEEEIGVFHSANEISKRIPIKSFAVISAGVRNGWFQDKTGKIYLLEKLDPVYTIIGRCENVKRPNKVRNLPKEEWKEVPGYPHNWCSNKGRTKIIDLDGTELLLTHIVSKNKNGREYSDTPFVDDIDKPLARARVSRVMARTFINPNFKVWDKNASVVVDHKNNDPTDNNLSNLRIVSQKDNIGYAIRDFNKNIGKPPIKVFAYNIRTKERRDYTSTIELIKDIFGSNNGGYFNCAYRKHITSVEGWQVFKDGDSYPRKVKGRVKQFKDLDIYDTGFAFNRKTGKYIGTYNAKGNFIVNLPELGGIQLGKIIAAMFNHTDLLEDALTNNVILIYKDQNKKNLNSRNLILMTRDAYRQLPTEQKQSLRKCKPTTNTRKPRKKKVVYMVDTVMDDVIESNAYEIAEKLNIEPTNVYFNIDKLYKDRYYFTYSEIAAYSYTWLN